MNKDQELYILDALKDWLEYSIGEKEVQGAPMSEYLRGWLDSKKDTLNQIGALQKSLEEDENTIKGN